jgi:hypothetical protein
VEGQEQHDEDESEEEVGPTTRKRWEFVPRQLDRTVLAIPLLDRLEDEKKGRKKAKPHALVIELNLEHPDPRSTTRQKAETIIREAMGTMPGELYREDEASDQYLYATLWGDTIRAVVVRNENEKRPIYRIWPDFPIGPL